jgi:hypothetical protein
MRKYICRRWSPEALIFDVDGLNFLKITIEQRQFFRLNRKRRGFNREKHWNQISWQQNFIANLCVSKALSVVFYSAFNNELDLVFLHHTWLPSSLVIVYASTICNESVIRPKKSFHKKNKKLIALLTMKLTVENIAGATNQSHLRRRLATFFQLNTRSMPCKT